MGDNSSTDSTRPRWVDNLCRSLVIASKEVPLVTGTARHGKVKKAKDGSESVLNRQRRRAAEEPKPAKSVLVRTFALRVGVSR